MDVSLRKPSNRFLRSMMRNFHLKNKFYYFAAIDCLTMNVLLAVRSASNAITDPRVTLQGDAVHPAIRRALGDGSPPGPTCGIKILN